MVSTRNSQIVAIYICITLVTSNPVYARIENSSTVHTVPISLAKSDAVPVCECECVCWRCVCACLCVRHTIVRCRWWCACVCRVKSLKGLKPSHIMREHACTRGRQAACVCMAKYMAAGRPMALKMTTCGASPIGAWTHRISDLFAY